MRVDSSHLVQKAVGHHPIDSPVDPFEQFFTWAYQSDFQNTERTLFDGLCAERGIRFTRHTADLDGMKHASVIFPVYLVVM